MHFVGIDPGGTTGVAVIDCKGNLIHSAALKKPLDVTQILDKCAERYGSEGFQVVIENFIGSGPRSNSMNYTLKLVGFFHLLCEYKGWSNVVQPPQRRKPYLGAARKLLTTSKWADWRRNGDHQMDALGHAIGYRLVWYV